VCLIPLLSQEFIKPTYNNNKLVYFFRSTIDALKPDVSVGSDAERATFTVALGLVCRVTSATFQTPLPPTAQSRFCSFFLQSETLGNANVRYFATTCHPVTGSISTTPHQLTAIDASCVYSIRLFRHSVHGVVVSMQVYKCIFAKLN
jgi:hypothetical protein